MAKLNKRVTKKIINKYVEFPLTHEGAPAAKGLSPELLLRRSVLSCLLWENTFYENGVDIATRIGTLVPFVDPNTVSKLATEARHVAKLRHAPLLLVREMARHKEYKSYVADALVSVINRPDELAEFLSIYWKDGKCPIANQVKKGLAKAFTQFNRYQLAKWNRNNEIKLRDVLFLCHAKPLDGVKGYTKKVRKNNTMTIPSEGSKVFSELVNNTLPTPDTWEVALSAGQDKKEAWTRLLKEDKLGAMALVFNLRNMQQAGVSDKLIKTAINNANVSMVLPYRFITAARYTPNLVPELEAAMFRSLTGMEKIPGKTLLLVDVSGSMDHGLSLRGDSTRMDAAAGLAVLCRELCEDVEIWTFSNDLKQVPLYRGFALKDSIVSSQPHMNTYLGRAVDKLISINHDRLVVFTDEQSHDQVQNPITSKSYMCNVASYKHGVGYDKWVHIDGFSEGTIKFICEYEKQFCDVLSAV